MSGFELSKRFTGEPIDCVVMVWHSRFGRDIRKSTKSSGSASSLSNAEIGSKMTVAPHSTSFLGIDFEGTWKPEALYLDPKQSAIRIGTHTWVLIKHIDAASQFTVEKEHAVAFPHESKQKTKQVYVSGHVGLYLHSELTNALFTMVFPDFELADVAFDAVNKLSYDQLSTEIFEEFDSDDDSSQLTSASLNQSGVFNKSGGAVSAAGSNSSKHRKSLSAPLAAAAAASKHGSHNKQTKDQHDDEDDDNFVAYSSAELDARARQIDTNEFTTFFLEGGGMGSEDGSGAAANAVKLPSDGVVRLRKDTGSLSTWIARMEPGDNEHIYMMKLSKAAIKAPLNQIIQRSNPSVARHFGPVVGLAFRNLTIRSESAHAQFVLEEVYTAHNSDTRVHRLICVFNSIDERMRWEEYLGSHGVKKRAIESAALAKKVANAGDGDGGSPVSPSVGGGAAGGSGGRDNKGDEKKAESAERKMDPAMQLIFECFPRPLGKGEDGEYTDYEDDGEENPFVGDSLQHSNSTPGGNATGSGVAFASVTSARRMMQPLSAVHMSSSLQLQPGSPGSVHMSPAASSLGSPTSVRANSNEAAGSGKQRKRRPGSSSPTASSSPASAGLQPRKTVEQEAVEIEAMERCRWFAGYQPVKENKWAALSGALKKEKTAGSQLFTAVAKLRKSSSSVLGPAALSAEFDPDADAHILAPTSPTSTSKNRLSALIRAGQIARAVEAISKHKENPQDAAVEQETVRAINALNELDAVEQAAMITEINKQQEERDTTREESKQMAAAAQRGASISPATGITPASLIDVSLPARLHVSRSVSDAVNAITEAQNASVSAIMMSKQQEQLLQSPTERQQQRLRSLQNVEDQDKESRHGAPKLSIPSELAGQLEHQRRIQHQNRIFLGERLSDGSVAASQSSAVTNPFTQSGSTMFGRPVLYGESLQPKYQPIEIRSEGYVDPASVSSALRKNAAQQGADDDTNNNSNNSPQHRSGDGDNENDDADAISVANRGSSPAADAARDFGFDFRSPAESSIGRDRANGGGAAGNEGWSSALYQSEKAHHRRHHHDDTTNNINNNNSSVLFSATRNQRRLVDTSSDSDDEASRRFSNARALRSINQLGEEFVGPSNATSGARNSAMTGSTSSLTGHLNPTCPLCGADRAAVAICKKTGRLHASLMPRYADATSSSGVYR